MREKIFNTLASFLYRRYLINQMRAGEEYGTWRTRPPPPPEHEHD